MKRPLAAAIIACLSWESTWSQCPQNDGFSAGGCCATAAPLVPAFPAITVTGLGACLLDCGLESQFPTTTSITPVNILCDYWLMYITINAGTFSITNQLLAAKYARTWTESPSATGSPIQVWRFLVNGDLQYPAGTAAGTGCPIPLSAQPPYSYPVHFIGSVDFARNCASGSWECAYHLTHFCPVDSHAPFSQRPIAAAVGWPKRTYHFVGPSNFTFVPCAAPFGNPIGESWRNSQGLSNPTVPYTCRTEGGTASGYLEIVNINCACADPGPVPPPARYTHQYLFGNLTCGGASGWFNSVFIPVPTLPTGMRALRIGSYTAAGTSYPGPECISVSLGLIEVPALCPPATPPATTLHVVSGVGTTGGFPVTLLDTPVPFAPIPDFLDLHDMLPLTPLGFVPGFGSLFASERVWSFNMP